jgi:Fic family protein
MQPSDFKPSRTGEVIKNLAGDWAFVPQPLPPRLDWDAELVALVETASRHLGELRGVAHRLVDPRLLIRPFVNREAVLSSRIEGTQSGLAELALFQLAKAEGGARVAQKGDAREVDNYLAALERGLASPLPVSLRLIREMHERLMRGARGEASVHPGEFRKTQNWIGPPGSPIGDATYVPPPPERLLETLDGLEKFINGRAELPALVRIALIHYQFEAIHPFEDGNGRIGRLLIMVLLSRWSLLPEALLYLSAFFEQRRDQYYRHLREISLAGAWRSWLAFFLTAVATEARDAVRRSEKLLALRDTIRARFPRGSVRVLNLVDDLFVIPAITISIAAKNLDVTFAAASRIVQKLVGAGVLEEGKREGRSRRFFAKEILRALQDPLPEETGG